MAFILDFAAFPCLCPIASLPLNKLQIERANLFEYVKLKIQGSWQASYGLDLLCYMLVIHAYSIYI